MEAAHTRVRETLTTQRGHLDALWQFLITEEEAERTGTDALAGDCRP